MIYKIGRTEYDGDTSLQEMVNDQKNKRDFEFTADQIKRLPKSEIKKRDSAQDILNSL